ncbi:hypothetical protein L0F63_004658 [Massospora cicadina]|nr:hypothetical protein L0F63_004658 [Massospora cicadina]
MAARSRQGLVRPLIKTCFPKAWLNEEFSPGITNFQFLEESCKKINESTPHKSKAGDYSQLASTLVHNVPPHELRKISKAGIRCLVLHGTRDYVIRPIYGKLLSSFLACPLVLFKKSGHMLMIERREEFNAILEAHIESQPLQTYLTSTNSSEEIFDISHRLVFSGAGIS